MTCLPEGASVTGHSGVPMVDQREQGMTCFKAVYLHPTFNQHNFCFKNLESTYDPSKLEL